MEAVDGDLDAGFDAEQAELAHGGGVVGALVGDPGQAGEVLAGEAVLDAGMVVGDDEDPAVVVEVGGGKAADDTVGHQEAVGGAEQTRGVVDDGDGGACEPEADARSLLVHDAGELDPEDVDGVVGGDEAELAGLGGRIEVRLAGEEAFEHVVGGGGAVQEDLPEGGEFVLTPLAGEELVVEVPAQPCQGGTHRRLTQAHTLSCPGDVAFFEEGAEGDHEVEIKTGQVHEAKSLRTDTATHYSSHR